MLKYLSDMPLNKSSIKYRVRSEAVIALYTARQFLPGFFARQSFLILYLILPLVDLATDWNNAGTGKFYPYSFNEPLIHRY